MKVYERQHKGHNIAIEEYENRYFLSTTLEQMGEVVNVAQVYYKDEVDNMDTMLDDFLNFYESCR